MDVKIAPNHCPACDTPRSYSHRYDAYYCQPCDTWLEDQCRDPGCEFCPDRPEKPSVDTEHDLSV